MAWVVTASQVMRKLTYTPEQIKTMLETNAQARGSVSVVRVLEGLGFWVSCKMELWLPPDPLEEEEVFVDDMRGA